MTFERDPLSVLYDDFSAELLAVLRGDMYGWQAATVRSPAGDAVDARGLSRHERALKRSAYYTLNSDGVRWVKNETESLQVAWDDPVMVFGGNLLSRLLRRSGQRVRVMRARLVSGNLAHHYVPSDGYVFDPAEQSQNLQL